MSIMRNTSAPKLYREMLGGGFAHGSVYGAQGGWSHGDGWRVWVPCRSPVVRKSASLLGSDLAGAWTDVPDARAALAKLIEAGDTEAVASLRQYCADKAIPLDDEKPAKPLWHIEPGGLVFDNTGAQWEDALWSTTQGKIWWTIYANREDDERSALCDTAREAHATLVAAGHHDAARSLEAYARHANLWGDGAEWKHITASAGTPVDGPTTEQDAKRAAVTINYHYEVVPGVVDTVDDESFVHTKGVALTMEMMREGMANMGRIVREQAHLTAENHLAYLASGLVRLARVVQQRENAYPSKVAETNGRAYRTPPVHRTDSADELADLMCADAPRGMS